MPDKKHLAIGTIVFMKGEGEMESYKVADYLPYFNTYLLRNCQFPLHTIQVHERRVKRIGWLDATIVVDEQCADEIDKTGNRFKLVDTPVESTHNEEYQDTYNKINSVDGILMFILRFAKTNETLGDATLLALRDKAEALDAMEIVHAIDSLWSDTN